jgi:peptidoglycan/LPS O-acetylase OafA/YrhL
VEFSGHELAARRARRLIPIFIGALAGFAYYSFIGCTTGTCPITSNPWISTGYGAFIGAVLAFGSRSKSNRTREGKE